jgi:hypothetical protein
MMKYIFTLLFQGVVPMFLGLGGGQYNAQARANEAQASGAAGQYGQQATNEGAALNPFFQQEMKATHGFDPNQTNELLTNAEAGAGGAFGGAEGQLKANAARTGNATGIAKSLDEMARDKGKAAAGAAEGIAAQDVMGAKQLNQQGAAGMQGLYGTNVSAQLGAMKQANEDVSQETATQGKDWASQLTSLANLGGSIASDICPAEGSLYLMADGTEKPVETLEVGEVIAGVDDEPQTIEEIQSAEVEIVRVTTDNGRVARNSLIHAFALPKGGFAVAAKSLGKSILTAEGPSRVISVEPAGKAWVFNIITNGSHTYRADGVWGLGVGDGERHIGSNVWARVNHKLAKETGLEEKDNEQFSAAEIRGQSEECGVCA